MIKKNDKNESKNKNKDDYAVIIEKYSRYLLGGH